MSRKLPPDTFKPKSRGINKPIPEEELGNVLKRLADGDTMMEVTEDLGTNRSALFVRATKDPEFEKKLYQALKIGSWGKIEIAYNAILGGEYSTGDIQRDKEIMAFAKWYASRVNRERFGDKVEIDHQQVVVNVPNWAGGGLLQRVAPALPAPEDDGEDDDA